MALPVCLVGSLFGRADNTLVQGVRDGANDARKRVELMLSSAEAEAAPRARLDRGRRVVAALADYGLLAGGVHR